MLITIICHDKPGSIELRMKTRPAHLEWLSKPPPALFIGPILADDGQTMIGSLYIAEFESLEAARAFNKADPYTTAGLFEKVIIQPVRQVYPK
jgi:uncharacterized protein YciI